MKGLIKRLCTGFLALATIATTLPTTVHASEKQYWTESTERVGIIEKVMNDGSISSTFNEGYIKYFALYFFRQSVYGMTEKYSPLGAWGV